MTLLDDAPGDAVRTPPTPRWVAPVFAVAGLATIPWTVILALSLPQQAHTHHYRLAWVGFDVMLVVVLLGTAYFAWRGRRVVGLLAACTATMLVVDAWFDVTTSPHREIPAAVLSAALIELPLAVVCGWIAMHVDQVIEQRLRRLSRIARQAATGAGPQRGFRPVARLRRSDRRSGPVR